MATTKGSKKGRATATRAKATARGRATSSTTKKTSAKSATSAKPKTAVKAKPAAKPVAKTKAAAPKRPVAPKRPATKPAAAVVENAEVTALKSKFQRERNGLEKRLTEAVREIGILRHHELRAMQLERQLAERDALIERLQGQLAEMQRRPVEPVYVQEVQQTLALGVAAREDEIDAGELDEFEEEQLVDDGDLISDD